jgi:hypothetical protein
MTNLTLFLFFCFLGTLLLSCDARREMNLSELRSYVHDPNNGLNKKSQSGDVLIELIYRPKDIVIAQFAEGDEQNMWDSIASGLKGYDYFLIRFSQRNKEIETNYAANSLAYVKAVDYLSGGISKDIKMSVDNEVIGVSDVMFSPSYGMTSASSVLLVFQSDLETRQSDFRMVFDDTQFGSGSHEFRFNYDAIRKLPHLGR